MVSAAQPFMKQCPTCGITTDAQWFCRNCGEFLRAPETERAAANLWRRFGAYVIDSVLFAVLLIIGWFIWFGFFTAKNGQTPGKQLLGVRVMRLDGTVPTAATMWLREVVVKIVIWGLVSPFSIIAYLWAFFDRDRQTVHDKMVSTYVVYHPGPVESMEAVPVTPEEQFGPQSATVGGAAGVDDELRRLAKLRDDGLITDQEYEEKRAEVVKRL